jgi:glyoxylase-like metal-dependent hydrolase (beta-lactamase superfamily II)
MMKVANGIEMLDLTANLALGADVIHPTLIWDNDTVILVDAGLPGQLSQFRDAMEKAGIPFDKLSKVIITHHDMDHIGSLSSILKESPKKIDVLAHEEERPYIQAEQPPIRLTQMEAQLNSLSGERGQQMKALYENLKANYKNFKVNVDKTVTDGEELPYCGGITVIYTPGHTPGHISLYLKQSKTLIAGDVLNVNDQMLVPAPPFTIFDKDSAIQSLKKLTLYDIETVICYHGGIYKDNPNQRIADLANC